MPANPVNTEILVNTAVDANQSEPRITALANGGFVVTWMDQSAGVGGAQGDTSGLAVKAQVYGSGGSRVGGEILVNTTTEDNQFLPLVAALGEGGFVVVWTDASEGNGDFDVRAQVFDAVGARDGAEILVNTITPMEQGYPQVAPLSHGGFVVAWADNSDGVDAADFNIKAQIFLGRADNFARSGGELLVNTKALDTQFEPVVAGLPEGRFVVVWQDYEGDGSGWSIKSQVFDADGTPIGTEILVNTAVASDQWGPKVASLENGGFVITWDDESRGVLGAGGDTSGTAVKGRVFSNAARDFAPVDTEFRVNSATRNDQSGAQIVALKQGGFVVTWSDLSEGVAGASGDNSRSASKAQVFDDGGVAIGPEILINTAIFDDQSAPRIAALPHGGFIVTWNDLSAGVGGAGGDGSGSAVKAQLFAANGDRMGSEFLVNTATESDQSGPQIAVLATGGVVVTWQDDSWGVGGAEGDTSGSAVKAQLFAITPPDITLGQVKAAHFNVLGLELADSAAQAIVVDLANKLYSFDAYIGTLVDRADLSTLPAVITNALLAGVAPTQQHLPELGAFVTLQYNAYRDTGSSNPALGIYEALGRGFSETIKFETDYGGFTDIDFLNDAYRDVFGRTASEAQVAHFEAQLAYFQALYTGVGESGPLASLHAKGAIIGQMIGHMVRDEPELHAIDDAAIAFLRAAGHGQARYGEPLDLI